MIEASGPSADQQPAATVHFLVSVADRSGEHIVAALNARLHFLQGLPPVLQALELPLRGDDGFDELALGRVLELEVEAFDRRAIRCEFLPQFQVKNGVSGEALQVIENDDVAVVCLRVHEPEQGDHAGTLHEVAAAGHVVVKDRFDFIAPSGRILPATMLLAVQAVSIVLLFFVGNPAVNDGPRVSRMRHGRTSFTAE